SCIRAGKAVTSWACPGVITMPIGRPSALVRALILVEKPPRERPSALRSIPPFRRPRNDAVEQIGVILGGDRGGKGLAQGKRRPDDRDPDTEPGRRVEPTGSR